MSPLVEMLMAFLMEMLKNCPEPEEKKLGFLKNPSRIQEARLFIKARASGMSRSDYRTGKEELDELRSEATDDDLRGLIAASAA